MRRVLCLVLVLCFALCSCGKEDAQKKEQVSLLPVTAAANTYNKETTRFASVVLNITKDGGEESCFFSQGSYSYRTEHPVAMSGRMTQIYKGAGNTADVYYKAGAYYRNSTDSKYYLMMDKETLLEQFICTNIPLAKEDTASDISKAETSAGTKYTMKVPADKKLLTTLFKETLYTASGLKKPADSKTAYGDVEYTYVVSPKGALTSFKLTAVATVYETAPYYPNYSVPNEELKHSFALSLELSALKTGEENVKIEAPKTSDYTFLS